MDKKISRLRRAKRGRAQIKTLAVARLTVYRTPRHIYAQVIDPKNKVLATASTLDKELRKECGYGGNIVAAKVIGKTIALRAMDKKVKQVAFDRSGFKYHGRIKALADAAREAGLEF